MILMMILEAFSNLSDSMNTLFARKEVSLFCLEDLQLLRHHSQKGLKGVGWLLLRFWFQQRETYPCLLG